MSKCSRLTLNGYFTSVLIYVLQYWSIPVAEGGKARVCCRSIAGFVGSNPAGDMDVCVL